MALQLYLLQFFDSVDISLEVSGYNSKIYYIVTQGPVSATAFIASPLPETKRCSMPLPRSTA